MDHILSINELKSISSGIDLIEISRLSTSNGVELSLSLEEFIRFCNTHNIHTVFYRYKHYDKDDYLITDDKIEEFVSCKKEFDFYKKWATEVNQRVLEFDFSQAYECIMICNFEGLSLIVSETNNWLPDDIKEVDDALASFYEENEDEIVELTEFDDEIDKKTQLTNELRNILLSDKDFRYRTNKYDRERYIDSFIKQKQNIKYLTIYGGLKNQIDRLNSLKILVNQIYNEYRNECYRLKIPVGEELPKEID